MAELKEQNKRKVDGDEKENDKPSEEGEARKHDKCAKLIAAVVIAVIQLSVVDWGGEEIARLEVRPSDTVLVGMRQVEDQLGVPPCRQVMVVGERKLEEADEWSGCCVSDWSTVHLTIISEVSCEEFSS